MEVAGEAIDDLRATFALHMAGGSRVFAGCAGEALIGLLIERGTTADLTEAPRKLYHAEIDLPVHAGENSFTTPEWIPGNHRPTGPAEDITGVVFSVDGKPLPCALVEHPTLPLSWRTPERTPGIDSEPLAYLVKEPAAWSFQLTLSPAKHLLEAPYLALAGVDCDKAATKLWQLADVLAPARAWAGFGYLDVTVHLPASLMCPGGGDRAPRRRPTNPDRLGYQQPPRVCLAAPLLGDFAGEKVGGALTA